MPIGLVLITETITKKLLKHQMFEKSTSRYCFIFGTNYLRMDQVEFFKGCLPQILLGPFLDTL